MTYLITFACYGTHLPGDPRGSFDHVRQGEHRFIPPNRALAGNGRSLMPQQPYELSTPVARALVRDAIIEVCRTRSWTLLALHIRVTHVHGLVEAEASPGRVLNDWKAYATRKLRTIGAEPQDRIVWAHSGHWREIRSRDAVASSIRCVLEGQGEPMERYPPE